MSSVLLGNASYYILCVTEQRCFLIAFVSDFCGLLGYCWVSGKNRHSWISKCSSSRAKQFCGVAGPLPWTIGCPCALHVGWGSGQAAPQGDWPAFNTTGSTVPLTGVRKNTIRPLEQAPSPPHTHKCMFTSTCFPVPWQYSGIAMGLQSLVVVSLI